jgi:hypothetical protein
MNHAKQNLTGYIFLTMTLTFIPGLVALTYADQTHLTRFETAKRTIEIQVEPSTDHEFECARGYDEQVNTTEDCVGAK